MAAPELLSLVLPLRLVRPAEADPPRWWGRAVHAALLRAIQAHDPALARTLHDAPGPRPFTVSSLLGPRPEGRPTPQAVYRVRLTALNAAVAAVLLHARQQGTLAPGQPLTLTDWRFEWLPDEADPNLDHSPWRGATTYAALSADLLTARQAPRRTWALILASPTTFHVAENHVPFPLPVWVFSSLWRKWNHFAPVAFPPETQRYAAEAVVVSRYRLSTRVVPLKAGGLRVGAVGQVVYRARVYDRYWMSVLEVLARFARFAGVGVGTAHGLGQARLDTPASSPPPATSASSSGP